ncbi:MAG: enoyl-CoA hydratase/isomerase family protein [Bacteroidetes bacterium]|nr:enoyl-CoA hydratase/isomerase family protein [Bacteroidota bacterium]
MIDRKIIDDIGILTVENPPQNYLLEPEFIPVSELKGWIEGNQLKALIITGSGRHFSGGAKLESVFAMTESAETMETRMNKGKALLGYLQDLNIPVAAAIKGICFGGGLEIALSCHIRICSENALFAFPEANQGLMPGLGGTFQLGIRNSLKDSLKMILGGDMINAEEAILLKIVDTLVKDEEPLTYALNFLRKITEGRPLKIINYVMQSLRNARELTSEESMREETRMFCDLARIESVRRKNESRESE